MDVYADEGGEIRRIGRAEVPEDCGTTYEVTLFGPSAMLRERFTIGTVTHRPPDGGPPVARRAVMLARGQHPGLLPGWRPEPS